MFGINEIIKIYPQLSKHILTNAINGGLLPVTWVGNQRCFYISDVEKYLRSKTLRHEDIINTWGNDE